MTAVRRSDVPDEFRQEEPPMTGPQKEYILSLISGRLMPDANRAEALKQLEGGLTKDKASAWIDRLRTLPRGRSDYAVARPDGSNPMPVVPDGRYAIGSDDAPLDPVKFYKVEQGKAGSRWEGFTFLSVFASDETYPIKDVDKKRTILQRIADDPKTASAMYGHKSRHCGICGRKLTKKESRELGIGPVCAAKAGWL